MPITKGGEEGKLKHVLLGTQTRSKLSNGAARRVVGEIRHSLRPCRDSGLWILQKDTKKKKEKDRENHKERKKE